MFWNALVRKGKAEGATEHDMDEVVAIHNNMNENTWRLVQEWEKLHQSEGDAATKAAAAAAVGAGAATAQPTIPPASARLSRFVGRPDDLSPKAWLKSLFG